MKRSGFFKNLLGILAGVVIAPSVLKAEPNRSVFDVKKIQDRIDYLEKHPKKSTLLRANKVEHNRYGLGHTLHFNPELVDVMPGNMLLDMTTGTVYYVGVMTTFNNPIGATVDIKPLKATLRRTCGNEFYVYKAAYNEPK